MLAADPLDDAAVASTIAAAQQAELRTSKHRATKGIPPRNDRRPCLAACLPAAIEACP